MVQGIAAAAAVLVSAIGLYYSRKKNKEDVSLATLVQAITSWKELAEKYQKDLEQCQLENETLRKELEELRNTVFMQGLQIQGKIPLDKG